MSLTSNQRDQARYKGSAEIRKRKSYLKRMATAIRQLADESTKDWSGLHGVFTEKELNLIRAAGKLVDRATSQLADDIRESDGIKAKYDRDVSAAHKQLAALPRATIGDIVAICAAESHTAFGYLVLDTLRTTRWLGERLKDMANDAIESLSWKCAREGRNPAEFTADVLRRMPELKDKHAELIRELNMRAVEQEMEKSA